MRLRNSVPAFVLAGLLLSCGDTRSTIAPDTTPPATIGDLAIQARPEGYLLSWTTPGDDGTHGTVFQYDIRYLNGDLLAEWDVALRGPSPASRVPGGMRVTQKVADELGVGTWQFGIRAGDEVPNWSDVSNIVSVTVYADTIPPAPVADLSVDVILGGVTLHWTAPGDDGHSGRAATYDLRFAQGVITEETWPDGTPVEGLDPPRQGGESESATLSDLEIDQEYSFALRTADAAGNWSDLSNVPTVFISQSPPTQLTFNTTFFGASTPNWSPDGSAIACGMGVEEGGHLEEQVVVPLNGDEPQQYTFSPNQALMPGWSPDGTRFAMVATSPGGYDRRLGVMNATPGADRQILASHDGLNVATPRWSPDGTRITYRVAKFQAGVLTIDIYTISATGGTPTFLAGTFLNRGLSWSPDGTLIAYDSDESGNADIWVIPSEGGSATRLTAEDGDETTPEWSPDGHTIAYVAGEKIWGIPATGGASVELISDSGIDKGGGLAWSPDGQRMAYTKRDPQSNIWVATINKKE